MADDRSDRLLNLIERKPTSDRLLLRILFFTVIASGLVFALSLNSQFISETPTSGGVLEEGVIGTPRFVNPVLAVTRADQDMTALVYSGLLEVSPEGDLVPDVAESVTVSEDGRTYNIVVRQDVRFHDGVQLTARDVAYTIALIQNPDLKSPLRGNWNGVLVEELGEYELNVVLEEAYSPFIENFTFGILPRHIWDELPIEQLPFSQHNTEPIGSGPFQISEVERNRSGLINTYTLSQFPDLPDPARLDRVVVRFYENEADVDEALMAGEITSSANLTSGTVRTLNENDYTVTQTTLPRTFGIFFNQNRSIVTRDLDVREALNAAIDREMLIEDVLLGYGVPATGPVPNGFLRETLATSSATVSTSSLEAARAILIAAGWEEAEDSTWQTEIDDIEYTLSVTLRTANTPLFEATANAVADRWRELGVLVNVEQFEQADLLQAVIRPREFEALLFGTDLSRAVDLFPFWHSSQKDDPGLNIAQYANIEADAFLETARVSQDEEEVEAALQAVDELIQAEVPALFLFSPVLTYVTSNEFTLPTLSKLSRPHERFMNIENWHAKTGALWPFFNE
ncbi:MAG: ABC transporter substrate-binding protein [Patescibacteria group bacterium]